MGSCLKEEDTGSRLKPASGTGLQPARAGSFLEGGVSWEPRGSKYPNMEGLGGKYFTYSEFGGLTCLGTWTLTASFGLPQRSILAVGFVDFAGQASCLRVLSHCGFPGFVGPAAPLV